RKWIFTLRGLAIPVCRLRRVCGDAAPAIVKHPQIVLRAGQSLLGSGTKPGRGGRVILGYAFAFGVEDRELQLGLGAARTLCAFEVGAARCGRVWCMGDGGERGRMRSVQQLRPGNPDNKEPNRRDRGPSAPVGELLPVAQLGLQSAAPLLDATQQPRR